MRMAGCGSGMSTSPEIHDFRAAAGQTCTSLVGPQPPALPPCRPSHGLFNRNIAACFLYDTYPTLWIVCG
jgi:hypothetical protein